MAEFPSPFPLSRLATGPNWELVGIVFNNWPPTGYYISVQRAAHFAIMYAGSVYG